MPDNSAIDVLFHPGRCDASTPVRAKSARPGDPAADSATGVSPEQALAAMDAAGVGCAFISQCKQWNCERQWMCLDTRLEDVMRYTRHSPRFIGLAGYNPFDVVESVREIEVAATLGLRGVYLHAASFGLALGDARYYPLFAKAAELDLPVVVQLGIAEPALGATVKRICHDIPELKLMLAQPRPEAALMQTLAGECENIGFVLDPAAVRHLARTASLAVLESGALVERCCWASNGASIADALAGARTLTVSPETLARFLTGNARRIFVLDQSAQARTPQSVAPDLCLAER